eukprot:272721_1
MSEQKSSSHDQDVTHGIEPDLDLLDFSKLEQADFDCPLCLRSLHDPLTITCGHTFCRDCLARALAIKKYCPLCREECHVEASSHATNALMSSLLEKCNRELVEARKEEVKIEKSQRKERLCVFLLDKVQFPGVNLYLQIYEPKYRVMMTVQCTPIENSLPLYRIPQIYLKMILNLVLKGVLYSSIDAIIYQMGEVS